MDYDALLNMGTELGYQLMYSGGEIYRVEESVRRLLSAYGLQPQVFAIPNCLIVSLNTPQGHPITQMRRIPVHGTDIELLERCNDLCRRLCSETPPLQEAKALVDALGERRRTYPGWVLLRRRRPLFLPLFLAEAFWIPCVPGCAVWQWGYGCTTWGSGCVSTAFSIP